MVSDMSAGSALYMMGPPRAATTTVVTTSNPTITTVIMSPLQLRSAGVPVYAPTGYVTFGLNQSIGSAGDAPLDAESKGSITVNWIPVGGNSVFATYHGDFNNLPSPNSAVIQQSVLGYDCNMTLTSSQNPSIAGSPITLTATVTSSHGTPNGEVDFYSDNGYSCWVMVI